MCTATYSSKSTVYIIHQCGNIRVSSLNLNWMAFLQGHLGLSMCLGWSHFLIEGEGGIALLFMVMVLARQRSVGQEC